MNDIYRAHHSHLGDLWMTVSLLASLGEPTRVSRWQNGLDIGPMLQDIIDVLDLPAGRITVVDEDGNKGFNATHGWRVAYVPTKRRWRPGPWRRVSFQFDGRSIAADKNPPPDQLAELLSDWVPPGFEYIGLGLPRTIAECVELLATSDAFVGICSGLSHLCHSTGTPCYLIEYRLPLEQAHRGKPYTRCLSAQDAITRVRHELGYPPLTMAPPPIPEYQPLVPKRTPASGFGRASDLAKVAPALPRLRKKA